MTLIFAHRGVSSAFPENTMSAFRAAENVGADGIELDVQISQDGELVVIHDEKVDRTTNGKGYVKDLTVKELQKLDASFKFKKPFTKNPIPTLREVFEWMQGNQLICNVELKNNIFPYEGIEQKLIGLIKEFRYENRIIISSFNHYSIVKCFQLAPEVEIAPLYSCGIYMPWIYADSIRAKGLHPNILAAPDEIIESSQKAGLAVRPYTVNDEHVMKRLFQCNCEAFFTDYPEKALQLRNNIEKS